MGYFRRYLYTFLITLGVLLPGIFAAVEVIDPNGENDWPKLFEYSFRSSVLNTRHLMEVLEREPSTLVFGTSRSALISPAVIPGRVLNFHTIYGNPKGVFVFLQRLNSRQIKNIREIFYLLDPHTFYGVRTYDSVDYTNTVERFLFKLRHFSTGSIAAAVTKVKRNMWGPYKPRVHPDGYTVPGAETRFNGVLSSPVYTRRFDQSSMKYLGEINRFATNHGIPITYFTMPWPVVVLKQFSFNEKVAMTQAFLQHIPAYYEWNYIPGISSSSSSFIDQTHANFRTVKKVMGHYRVPDFRVDRKNMEAQMERLRPYFKEK